MGPKAYALKNSGSPTKESSWMDRMCQKIETYCDLGEPGRGPSLIFQEFEVQFNTIGAGLRKFANEANDFVQEMLAVPIGTDGTCEKVVDLPKQRDGKVVQGEKQVAKQPMKQQAAAPMNFFDEACMKMSTKGEAKENHDTDLDYILTNLKVAPAKDVENSPFGDASWDWPQQTFDQSTEPQTEERLYQEVAQASCSSLEFSDTAIQSIEDLKQDETVEDVEENKDANEMIGGEVMAASWSSADNVRDIQRDTTTDESLVLDGWEGDDIVINDEELEPDTWHDWELV